MGETLYTRERKKEREGEKVRAKAIAIFGALMNVKIKVCSPFLFFLLSRCFAFSGGGQF